MRGEAAAADLEPPRGGVFRIDRLPLAAAGPTAGLSSGVRDDGRKAPLWTATITKPDLRRLPLAVWPPEWQEPGGYNIYSAREPRYREACHVSISTRVRPAVRQAGTAGGVWA